MLKLHKECSLMLPEAQPENKILFNLQNDFYRTHNQHLIIGAELEFYLSPNIKPQDLENELNIKIFPERGQNQHEIKFDPTTDLHKLAENIASTRRNIINYAQQRRAIALFDAKPFPDDYGSSLQININATGDHNIEYYAAILCIKLDDYINSCLTCKDDYKRLDHKFMAPTHICWGGNNRSVMIRIPDIGPKRIEHRLPGANTDPNAVISSMVKALMIGLADDHIKAANQFPKIYGNAYDQQYQLKLI